MIARGQHEHPELDLRVLSPGKLPFADATFEAVLLFAVLTCIPRDEDLFALIAEISRVLCPRGVLYLSDYCLQSDARNVQRYRENESRFGTYGVFALPDGAVVRHFDPRWLDQHLTEYAVLDGREVEIATMNGNPGRATQMLLRKTHP
jgi:SAM-dependent methyltransferase